MFLGGDQLRALRESKGLSVEEVERRSGLPCSYISQVEDGQATPTLEKLERLAAALEVPVDRLSDGTEELTSLPNLPGRLSSADIACGRSRREKKKS